MTVETIEKEFRDKVCAGISLVPEGLERFRVDSPFQFDDGDHLSIVLRREAAGWVFSDEGHTFIHLSYEGIDEKDLQRGTRQKIISNALSSFSVIEREGELVLPVPDERFGDALYSFVQALLKISDVSFLSRETVRSAFWEDFRHMLSEVVPQERRIFDWTDPGNDPQGMYPIDCRINSIRRPLFVFALGNDDRVRDATITLLQFEKWNVPHRSMAVFEDQESIARRVLARFSDVCEKQFSHLGTNRARITRYLAEVLQGDA